MVVNTGSALWRCCLMSRRTATHRPSLSEQRSGDFQAVYEWSKLTNKDQIRLLVLKPGWPYDDLECELTHVQISDNPTFEAISYAWESEDLPRTIYCSKRPLGITENLFSALRNFRLPTSDRILWVDAICINQRDLTEKSEQVGLMGTIFKSAQRVRVWLGEATQDTALAYSYLKYSERERESHNVVSTLMKGNIIITEAATTRLRNCMAELFCRKWFSRLWVVQEVTQAAEVIVHCGSLSLPFETLFQGLQQLTTEAMITSLDNQISDTTDPAANLLAPPSVGLRTLKTMHQYREKRGQQKAINLAGLLRATRHCKVTDPRDRVFALLSLSDNEALAKPFPIDYTISAAEMYSRFAEWYYTTNGLGLMSFATTSSQLPTLRSPSWAPNWTDVETFRPFWDYTKQFSAGGKGPATGYVAPKQVLNINGKVIDFIADTIEHPSSFARWNVGGLFDDDAAALRAEIEACAAFFDNSKTLCEQLWKCADFSDAQYNHYWRTLVANTHYGGAPALDSDRQDFQQLNEYMHLSHEERGANILNAAITTAEQEMFYPARSVQEFGATHEIVARGRVFVTSKAGAHIGWAPYGTRTGDLIVVFEGGEIPFVIRPVTESTFRLVGECYLHGIMFGEAWANTEMPEGLFKLV